MQIDPKPDDIKIETIGHAIDPIRDEEHHKAVTERLDSGERGLHKRLAELEKQEESKHAQEQVRQRLTEFAEARRRVDTQFEAYDAS